MPVQGLVRKRKHQFVRQSDQGVAAAATRAYPFRGVPQPNLNWTDPEIDAGALAIVAPPIREAPDLSSPLTDPSLKYNNLPLLLCAIFGGHVSPTGGGTAKTWALDPDMETPDLVDFFTYEFGDDVLTDWYQFVDSHLESLEITGPDGLGALTVSMTWRHGIIHSTGSTDSPVDGTVPTPGLDISTTDIIVYLKDCAIFIADTFGGLGAGQVSDALHNFVLRITKEYDEKRWANGSQSFDVDDLAPTGWAIEYEATFSKTADTVGTGSESDHWMADQAVDRYIRNTFTSLSEAQGGTPYSWTYSMPARYYTREDGEIGGNTVITLTAHAFFDGTRFFPTTVVNTLTDAALGTIGS